MIQSSAHIYRQDFPSGNWFSCQTTAEVTRAGSDVSYDLTGFELHLFDQDLSMVFRIAFKPLQPNSHFFIDYLPKGTYFFEYSTPSSSATGTRPA